MVGILFLASIAMPDANAQHGQDHAVNMPPSSGDGRKAWLKGVFAGLLALSPVLLPVGAGFYSAVQQCDKDATDLETQLTSTLLEIQDREARILYLLKTSQTAPDALNHELVQIETGADGHYSDPAFKDHALAGLVNQYNRLLRRADFPPEDVCGETVGCLKRADLVRGLQINTGTTHAAIVSLDLTKAEAHAQLQDITNDMAQVNQQLDWHKLLGPIHRCSPLRMIRAIGSDGTEPWKLIRLVPRA